MKQILPKQDLAEITRIRTFMFTQKPHHTTKKNSDSNSQSGSWGLPLIGFMRINGLISNTLT